MAIKGLNPDWIDFSTRIPESKTNHITRQFRELSYGPAELQKLDVYLPEEGSGPFPVIVNVHGGGFSVCDKHDFHLYPTLFALQQGFAVAAINYRLSPAVRYPEHYYDLKRALLWLVQNGLRFNLDTDQLFLWGTSAGGNLVLQAACKTGIPLPEELIGAKDIQVNAVAALCPGIDFTHLGNSGTLYERIMVKLLFLNLNKYVFGSNRVPAEAARLSNPTTYIREGIAPVYLQHGTRDPAIPFAQIEEFARQLEKVLSTQDFVFDVLEGAPHAGASEHYFLQKNVDPILSFFKRHMA
jgi:acetyl esterase/lipase